MVQRKLLSKLALAPILLAFAGPAAAQEAPPPPAVTDSASERLRDLLARAERAERLREPLSTPRPGETLDLPAFVDPLSDAYARHLEADTRAAWAALQAIDPARLSSIERIQYDVLRYRTARTLHLFDTGLSEVGRQAALNPSFGLHVALPDFVAGGGARFESDADYERGLARLEGFASYLENVVAQLRRGVAAGRVQPRIIVENVLAQVDAMLALPVEESPFLAATRKFPDAMAPAERARFAAAYREKVENKVYPGYRLWKTYLSETYLPLATAAPGRSAMKDGAALYAAELARHTTTDMSAEAIHSLGLGEVARIRADMEATRQKIGFDGDLKAFFEHVRTNPKFYYTRPEDLIAHFEAIEARIRDKLPTLFHAVPKAAFEVRPLPAIGEQRGTGYYRSGPADASGPGILFFNMAMLDTRPIPTLETLTLHEGLPGHHFQLSLVQEDAGLPPLLRFGGSTAYTEGWGLYSESLGRDLGLFDDPYQWFGRLDMEMLRAVRLVVDTGLHAKGWGRQQAIDYMLANTSMAPGDVVVEIDRYIAWPGQATAYKIGGLKLQALRERSDLALGPAFDIRDFHQQVLDTGALPLDVLEGKIDRWLAEAAR
ncbi:DUF885 domain-containing protein [Enterovirga sp. GCM10030262]|uniref:DUF885 domain-containing protein n=1 Tax=Enterovirga sp. GCM10030262 TaxID=3273391 RepID=UPI00360927DB